MKKRNEINPHKREINGVSPASVDGIAVNPPLMNPAFIAVQTVASTSLLGVREAMFSFHLIFYLFMTICVGFGLFWNYEFVRWL